MATKRNRVREADYDMKWYGFNIKRGMLYGIDNKGSLIVWTGKVADVIKHDDKGKTYAIGKKVLVFRAYAPNHWESDQTQKIHWGSEWIPCGSGIGKKILEKSVKRQNGIIPDYNPKYDPERMQGRHFFKSDKSRFSAYSAEAYKYQR